ncbi:MAG TPA: hypothetical protein VFW12_10630 [Candidatus Limnocylindria bacterium]|nr:hypothetical protein [Candidatus Limnocylindria bacterium]
MLDAQSPSPALILDIVLGAIDAHLDPQVAEGGEDPLRRRMKEVGMDSLRSRKVLVAVGLLLPVAFFVAAYLMPGVISDGAVFGGLAIVTALATGLVVGRWWAPLSLVIAWPTFILGKGGSLSEPAEIAWTAMMAVVLAVVCLVGVGVRVLIARSSGQMRDRPA